MFRIRELTPRRELATIFVVELPYATAELSRLPDATAYRRAKQFEDEWVHPACAQLGWELVAAKTCDGSFFLYMYGARDPGELVAKLAPFDGALAFYDDHDPEWDEYAALRELLDRAKAVPAPATVWPEATRPTEKKEPVTRRTKKKMKRPAVARKRKRKR
jgi:hypothetical protein